jgi:hypothetical protein
MENKLTKLENPFSMSFQLITVGLLILAIALIMKQQSDISILTKRIDDIESKLDDVESNLSSEIDDVKSTVRIWSN